MYGVQETNPLPDGYHDEINPEFTVDLDDNRLQKIIRLRLVSDPGHPFWDISYCHGQLTDGTYVRVELPVFGFRRKTKHYRTVPSINEQLYKMCVEAGVNGRDLGIYSVVSTMY